MTSLNDTVHTVNAAASAIVSADARVQPTASPKRSWRNFWRVYWCFGSLNKNSKRIGHAVLVPEPVVLPGAASAPTAAATTTNTSNSTSVVIPFIAPPSSPASFIQSCPPPSSGALSLASLSVKACGGPASIFAIGPYTYETQLVSPPVFSTFTTQPSTAPLTPHPESVHQTTPSSPEVPFAQLLTSSLNRTRRNSGNNQRFAWSHYEVQSYPLSGSPGTSSHLISPGSVISNSGTSSPFPDGRLPILGLRLSEAPKLLAFEHYNARKWGSRLGSGSLTPDGVGSRLGSGSLTPDGGLLLLGNGSKTDELVINHRVSFELTGEDVARCLANKSFTLLGNISEYPQDTVEEEGAKERDAWYGETSSETHEVSFREAGAGEENVYRKQRSITLGSAKDFNFDSSKGDVSDKPSNHWTFFPMLNPGVS